MFNIIFNGVVSVEISINTSAAARHASYDSIISNKESVNRHIVLFEILSIETMDVKDVSLLHLALMPQSMTKLSQFQ